jgi:putative sterol carrier protein
MIDTIIAKISEQAASAAPIGDTIKFMIDDQAIVIDGTGDTNTVSQDDVEAACTISTTADTFAQLQSGDLNPMAAVMGGKVKIAGDMGLAMKLQSLLG